MRSVTYSVRVVALALALGMGAAIGGASMASAETDTAPGQGYNGRAPGLYVQVLDGRIDLRNRNDGPRMEKQSFGYNAFSDAVYNSFKPTVSPPISFSLAFLDDLKAATRVPGNAVAPSRNDGPSPAATR